MVSLNLQSLVQKEPISILNRILFVFLVHQAITVQVESLTNNLARPASIVLRNQQCQTQRTQEKEGVFARLNTSVLLVRVNPSSVLMALFSTSPSSLNVTPAHLASPVKPEFRRNVNLTMFATKL